MKKTLNWKKKLFCCNVLGIPVSATTVIVGSVAGVGVYNNIVNTDNNNNHHDKDGKDEAKNANDNYNEDEKKSESRLQLQETKVEHGCEKQTVAESDHERIPMSSKHLMYCHEKVRLFCSTKLTKIDLKTIGKIILTWTVTIPANAVIWCFLWCIQNCHNSVNVKLMS